MLVKLYRSWYNILVGYDQIVFLPKVGIIRSGRHESAVKMKSGGGGGGVAAEVGRGDVGSDVYIAYI